MSLLAQRKANFYDVVLGAEHPGVEIVTYTDKDSSRSIWVKRTTDEAPPDQLVIPAVMQAVDRLLIRVGRDPTHTKGGVITPRIGDKIIRVGESVPYSFTGRVISATPHSHTLEFTRSMTNHVGTKR